MQRLRSVDLQGRTDADRQQAVAGYDDRRTLERQQYDLLRL